MQPSPQSFHQKFLNGIRYFNKYIFNHLTLLFAGTDIGPFSKLIHKGRKSGKTFHTPVLATYVGNTVIIPLSYGEQVDWLRNIIAAGGCEIIYRKNRKTTTNPEVVTGKVALSLLPEKRRRIFERFKLENFLRLQIIQEDIS
ncbi:MAG: nitroreductase [Anaerolineaceae bacterium]|nr:nitroreductase [Anaerolineaceae bacterium]